MEKKQIISNAISNAIAFLESEIQCVEDETLAEEYQDVIDDLEEALQLIESVVIP